MFLTQTVFQELPCYRDLVNGEKFRLNVCTPNLSSYKDLLALVLTTKSPYKTGPVSSTRYKMERPRQGCVNLPYLSMVHF